MVCTCRPHVSFEECTSMHLHQRGKPVWFSVLVLCTCCLLPSNPASIKATCPPDIRRTSSSHMPSGNQIHVLSVYSYDMWGQVLMYTHAHTHPDTQGMLKYMSRFLPSRCLSRLNSSNRRVGMILVRNKRCEVYKSSIHDGVHHSDVQIYQYCCIEKTAAVLSR